MGRRAAFKSNRPMAPKALGKKKRCDEAIRTTADGLHEIRCEARPHDDTERHRPGPWIDTEAAA